MMKKMIAAALAAVMCLAVFSGCKKKDTDKLIMATEAGFALMNM